MNEIDTPALDKLAQEKWKTELIHEFLEFAAEQGAGLAGPTGVWLSTPSTDKLMAEFIGIDLKEVEAEKQAILNSIRMHS